MEMRKSSLRVIILNQPFDKRSGGGITLSNLFENIPPENLAVVTTAQLINEHTDFEKCSNYYQLGVKEQKWIFPFSLLRATNFSGQIFDKKIKKVNHYKKSTKSRFRNWLIMRFLFPLIKYLGIYQAIYKLEPSIELLTWIQHFKPDVIYAQAQNLQGVRFCQLLKRQLAIPLVFHMMDDWVSLPNQSFLSKLIWKKKTNREFKRLLTNSEKFLSISDYMSQEYFLRYGEESEVYHNPVDEEFWLRDQKSNFLLSENPMVLYAGRVGLGINESLITMAKAITELNIRTGNHIKFVIQTEVIPSWVKKYDCVFHRELVPYSELPFVFSNADILFLPYDFSKKSIEFIKYSMPTKASEYMICGTPILLMAPEDTAIIKNAIKFGWAYVVCDNKLKELVDALQVLLFDENARKRFSETAKNTAISHHRKTMVQENFMKVLYGVSRSKSNE